MTSYPSFPFYPTDFLGDKNVMIMDAEQVGMYWLLINFAWQDQPCGTLPNDEVLLAKYARVSLQTWRKKSDLILQCFESKNGRLFQKRLVKERKKQDDWRKKSREGGLRSGISRRRVVEPPLPNGMNQTRTKGQPNTNLPKPNPKPNPKRDKRLNTLSGNEPPDGVILEILEYLNAKAGRHFTLKGKQSDFVRGRLRDGATVEQMKKIIDNMTAKWLGTDQAGFLRPQTLFAPIHFEDYLDQPKGGGNGQSGKRDRQKAEPGKYDHLG